MCLKLLVMLPCVLLVQHAIVQGIVSLVLLVCFAALSSYATPFLDSTADR